MGSITARGPLKEKISKFSLNIYEFWAIAQTKKEISRSYCTWASGKCDGGFSLFSDILHTKIISILSVNKK